MSPKKFDRYMVRIGIGTHPKLAELTDGEFRAHVAGVLAVAAMAPVRGCLLVGELAAEAAHVAAIAGVKARVASSAMRKLEAVGVLEHHEALGCLCVHDWDDVNPEPKDATAAERQRRRRQRLRHGGVTANVTRDIRDGHGSVTANVTPPPPHPPLEGGKDIANAMSVESGRLDTENSPPVDEINVLFAYWQERCGHPHAKLTAERRTKIRARLREKYTAEQIKLGIDGAATNPPTDKDSGVVYDDLVSICRNGSQLERYIARAKAKPAGTGKAPVEGSDEFLRRRGAR